MSIQNNAPEGFLARASTGSRTSVTTKAEWEEVRLLLEELYDATARLEVLFPGRKFTLDGHLVGSIGEVIAAYMFDLELHAASTMGHYAICQAGRCIEIKLTQGRSVSIRHKPEHLLVPHRPPGGPVQVVYNGPGELAWAATGRPAVKRSEPD